MLRLAKKFDTARKHVPQPVVEGNGHNKVGIIAYGSSHWAIIESRDQMRKELGMETDYMRVRGYPFPNEVRDFIDAHERTYIVEQNRDAQLYDLLRLDLEVEQVARLRSIAHAHGLPLDARSVTEEIRGLEGK
jgi:2-oxoglutarate ferredoxin oxidoreductase subunit alpha